MCFFFFFFFFQAEDGIRDWSVTGVQTCALPIYAMMTGIRDGQGTVQMVVSLIIGQHFPKRATAFLHAGNEIGRASCRERVPPPPAAAPLKKKERRQTPPTAMRHRCEMCDDHKHA